MRVDGVLLLGACDDGFGRGERVRNRASAHELAHSDLRQTHVSSAAVQELLQQRLDEVHHHFELLDVQVLVHEELLHGRKNGSGDVVWTERV